MKKSALSWFILTLWCVFLVWRFNAPAPSLDEQGAIRWAEIMLLLLSYCAILFTALGLGKIILRQSNLSLERLEFNLLATLLGLAAISLAVLAIGLVGWLNPTGLFTILALGGLLSRPEWARIWTEMIQAVRLRLPDSAFEFFIWITGAGLLGIAIFNALTPAWDYDALMYHLEIPELYLTQGRVYFDPQVWRTGQPLLGEMMYAVAIALRLNPLAKLINLTYAILFIVSAYAFGSRFFSRSSGLLAVGIILGMPALPFWATWAKVDLAWAGYEFWAVYALMLWDAESSKNSKWLILAGILSGLAASVKYLSLPVILIVAVILLWKSTKSGGFRQIISNLWTYGLFAGLVMAPWYVKNWLWTGNPIYPLIWGGPGRSFLTEQLLNEYVGSFGFGHGLLDLVLLPYRMFAHPIRFSIIGFEIFHPALWLAFGNFFFLQSKKRGIPLLYSSLVFLSWFFSSQQVRFLLPVSAFIAILAANTLEQFPRLLQKSVILILGVTILLSVSFQISYLQHTRTVPYLAGQISARQFLREQAPSFRMLEYIESHLKSYERVQFLWDGRGYYCDARCIPDDEQSTAVTLSTPPPFPQMLARTLRAQGITHLMLSRQDAIWFIVAHDPHGRHQQALDYFEKVFIPACGRLVFKDGEWELFQITCP